MELFLLGKYFSAFWEMKDTLEMEESDEPDSDAPHLRVSSWRFWISDFSEGPICMLCVCASTLFFKHYTLPPGQFCSAFWRIRGPGKWGTCWEASPSLSSSLGLLSAPRPSHLASALQPLFLFWGAPVNFPIFGDHPRETSQPELFSFSNVKSDWLDLVFSPAVMCWIEMGALKISQIIVCLGGWRKDIWLPWDIKEIGHFSCLSMCLIPECSQVLTVHCCFSRLSLDRTNLPWS